jgi:hypothetical protein
MVTIVNPPSPFQKRELRKSKFYAELVDLKRAESIFSHKHTQQTWKVYNPSAAVEGFMCV